LQLAFAAARMSRKNIEDELRAVNYAARGVFFDVALLHRGKIAVEYDERRIFGVGFGANFIEFSPADERRGIGGVPQLEDGTGYIGAGAAGQFDQLGKGFAFRRASGNSRDPG
jgi:hypothetical protein